jgi:hypothetical protein
MFSPEQHPARECPVNQADLQKEFKLAWLIVVSALTLQAWRLKQATATEEEGVPAALDLYCVVVAFRQLELIYLIGRGCTINWDLSPPYEAFVEAARRLADLHLAAPAEDCGSGPAWRQRLVDASRNFFKTIEAIDLESGDSGVLNIGFVDHAANR